MPAGHSLDTEGAVAAMLALRRDDAAERLLSESLDDDEPAARVAALEGLALVSRRRGDLRTAVGYLSGAAAHAVPTSSRSQPAPLVVMPDFVAQPEVDELRQFADERIGDFEAAEVGYTQHQD